MHILVVDARFESRWLVSGWLGLFVDDVAIGSSASAQEALNMIGEKRPDVVLASHPMPGTGCVELARSIKAAPNPALLVVLTDMSAETPAEADFCVEKRFVQTRLLPYLAERFSLKLRRVSAFAR
jgi:CheY-like chemotaxis protein